MNDLMKELHATHDALDAMQFGWMPDMDGTLSCWVEPSDEAQNLLARGAMLVELLHLKEPLQYGKCSQVEFDLGTDWQMVMHNQACPCPGVPEWMWSADVQDDPEGDMMGRNE